MCCADESHHISVRTEAGLTATILSAVAFFVVVISLHTEGYACHQNRNPQPHGRETSCNGADECHAALATCNADLGTSNDELAACLAAPNSLFPATGQTTASQADKNDGIAGPVDVPDDGTVQAGAPLTYTDNEDGTITDNNTGLMWEKKAACYRSHLTVGAHLFRRFTTHCQRLYAISIARL